MNRLSARGMRRRERLEHALDRTMASMSVRYEPEPPVLPESVLVESCRALLAGLDAPHIVTAKLRARVKRESALAHWPWLVDVAPASMPNLTKAQRGHLTIYATDWPDAMRRAHALVATARGHQ